MLFLGLLAFTARPATDPDLWWHLRTGQWIVENRQIPHTDSFSFTRNGSTWVSHEWLSELAFFWIWHYTGWAGLIIFSAFITTLGFIVLFGRCRAAPHWSAAVTTLGALAAAPAWGVRPQMFTFTLASLWMWLLEAGEQRPWLLIWIPPAFLLWLNLHAGFALGPALLLAYCAGMMWEVVTGNSERRTIRSYLLKLALVLAACVALVPLNPSGTELYRYPLGVLRSGMMRSFISEWHSPDFHSESYIPLMLVIVLLLISLAMRRVRVPARILIPLLGTFLAAIDAVRHIAIFILLATPVIAAALPNRQTNRWKSPSRSTSRRLQLALTSVLLSALAVFTIVRWLTLTRDQGAHEAKLYPARAVDQLIKEPSCDRVFAYYDWGGYLIWRLSPACKVFIDGRADLYGDAFLREFQGTMQLRPGWDRTLDRWRVDSILIPPSSALAQALLLDPGWASQYSDTKASLFVRRSQPARTHGASESTTNTSVPRLHSLGEKSEKIFTRAGLNLRN